MGVDDTALNSGPGTLAIKCHLLGWELRDSTRVTTTTTGDDIITVVAHGQLLVADLPAADAEPDVFQTTLVMAPPRDCEPCPCARASLVGLLPTTGSVASIRRGPRHRECPQGEAGPASLSLLKAVSLHATERRPAVARRPPQGPRVIQRKSTLLAAARLYGSMQGEVTYWVSSGFTTR